MKIQGDGNSGARIDKLAKREATSVRRSGGESRASGRVEAEEQVSLSTLAERLVAELRDPATRETRVQELKAAVRGGNYPLDEGRIADGVLRDMLLSEGTEE